MSYHSSVIDDDSTCDGFSSATFSYSASPAELTFKMLYKAQKEQLQKQEEAELENKVGWDRLVRELVDTVKVKNIEKQHLKRIHRSLLIELLSPRRQDAKMWRKFCGAFLS